MRLLQQQHPLHELRVGVPFRIDDSPGIRMQRLAMRPLISSLPQSSRPVPPGEPLDDSPLPNYPIRDIALTERDKPLLTELRRSTAMPSRGAWSPDTLRLGQKASKEP